MYIFMSIVAPASPSLTRWRKAARLIGFILFLITFTAEC